MNIPFRDLAALLAFWRVPLLMQPDAMAQQCYEYADAMFKEAKKRNA